MDNIVDTPEKQTSEGAVHHQKRKRKPRERPTVEPLAYGTDTAAVALGVPERAVQTLIAEGRLRSIKLGRRRLIPRSAIEELIEAELRAAE